MSISKDRTKAVFLELVDIIDSPIIEPGQILPREFDVGKAAWDLVSALRGPDHDVGGVIRDRLKSLFTERIRAIAGFSRGNRFYVALAPLEADEVRVRNEIVKDHISDHFILHSVGAINALVDLGFDVPEMEANWKFGLTSSADSEDNRS